MAESALRNLVPSINTAMNNAAQAPFGRPQRIPIYRNEPEFIDRSLNPQNYPVINNPDGSISSHRMAAEVDENGNWYVFPTIQMQPDGTLRQYDDAREAMKAAFMTGNILSAPNMESALQYAEGGYKVGTPMEQPRSAPAQEPVQPAPESALRQLVPQSAEPFVRSYNPFNPAFRETMRASISDLLGGRAMGGTPTQRYRANIADMLTGAVEMAPGVGEAVGVTDTRQAIRSGDYGTAAMLGGATALGMVPVIGDAASRAIREGLDMSQAARMQRAREQGFYVDMPLYHGTDKGFEEFSPKTGLSGRASYFTDNPEVASAYAMGDVRYKKRGPEGSQVIPAFVRGNLLSRETLTRQAEADIWKQIEKDQLKKAKPGTLKYEMLTDPRIQKNSDNLLSMSDADYMALNSAYNYFPQLMEELAETKKTEKILKGLGYDGVKGVETLYSPRNMLGDVQYNSIAIFDPKNIRSVNAAFDPAKTGSSNLMAGVGGLAVGLSALNQLVPRNEERRPD